MSDYVCLKATSSITIYIVRCTSYTKQHSNPCTNQSNHAVTKDSLTDDLNIKHKIHRDCSSHTIQEGKEFPAPNIVRGSTT